MFSALPDCLIGMMVYLDFFNFYRDLLAPSFPSFDQLISGWKQSIINNVESKVAMFPVVADNLLFLEALRVNTILLN